MNNYAMLRNLMQAITDDAGKRKEKVIAVDAETFEDVYGKEIRLRFSTSALESMKKELEVLNETSVSYRI